MSHHVFVYGTLMRGEKRHWHLATGTFITAARTIPRYRMHDAGDYPALIEVENGVSIAGEVWLVGDETLQSLDDVEGVDEGLYARRRVPLLPPHEALNAEAYLYRDSVEGMREIGPSWRDRSHC